MQIQLLLATAVATAAIWPIQDHARRVFYLARRAWVPSMLSLTATAVVVSCVLLSLQGNIDPLWVPFGSLALANFIALLLGVTIARQGSTKQDRPSLPRLLERMPERFLARSWVRSASRR